MKKSYKKLMIFEIIILCILFANIFTHNIINNYMIILFLLLLIGFFIKLFGVEKTKKRYTKELFVEISIVYVIFFVLYYLFGLVTGFYKSNNYFNLYGVFTFIIPNTLIIVFKEYLRGLVHTKFDDSKLLFIFTFLLFLMIDLINVVKLSSFTSVQNSFYFSAISLIPLISANIAANKIVRKSNYKVNIFWLLILNLYVYIFPIIPNVGDYILSIIKIVLPLVILARINAFYENEEDEELDRDYNKKNIIPIAFCTLFTAILVYFSCGYFRFYAVAIASGSMTPNILKGDIVVIDKKDKEINVGDVIAYKYKNTIVVHRLIKKINKGSVYYYTKGDANNLPDNYVINEEDIIGVVCVKIPYLGLPTVWLNDL